MRAINGDCSRRRRTADRARMAYYAAWRQRRFAKRFLGQAVQPPSAPKDSRS